ncbi:MAG: hypothetical protein H6618_07050 [Deltaproteobacteria bacterium]|nr:hypothetical protein [Deltaproteobacteria bacterium]
MTASQARSVHEADDKEGFSFAIRLSMENPFEHHLIHLLSKREPVRVGHLRFVVGHELIRELIIRGAVSLESDSPGALGIQHLSEAESRDLAQPVESRQPESSQIALKDLSCTQNTVKTPEASSKTCAQVQKHMQSDEIPRLDLNGFDFGSSPVGA